MDRENPTSGLVFFEMMVLALSAVSVVLSCCGSASSSVHPSSKASRAWLSKRPLALDRAPRPRTVICWVNVLTREIQAAVGATQTLMRRQGDWWVTAVGDVPAGTLKLFANALERRRP